MFIIKHQSGTYLSNKEFPACWGDKKFATEFDTEEDANRFCSYGWAPSWIAHNITIEHKFHVSGTEAYRMLRSAQVNSSFRPFSREDWEMFAGCETKSPEIAEIGEYLLVLDGDVLGVHHTEDQYGGQTFKLALQAEV